MKKKERKKLHIKKKASEKRATKQKMRGDKKSSSIRQIENTQ